LGEPEQIHAGIISGADHLTSSVPVKLPFKVGGPGADWHRYGVAWSADEIVWYVDRKEVRRVPTPSDMKQVPMYLLLNLAVGGKWGGWPDETTPWPGEFTIQRVSVWKLPS
jgi:beta-glucanase (GH16 family)